MERRWNGKGVVVQKADIVERGLEMVQDYMDEVLKAKVAQVVLKPV